MIANLNDQVSVLSYVSRAESLTSCWVLIGVSRDLVGFLFPGFTL